MNFPDWAMQGNAMQEVANLHQLAGLYADSLVTHLPHGPCIIAGVGLCSMAAFELAAQLHHRGQQVQLLMVFESVPVTQAKLALPVIDEAVTSELLHVWCSLYQLIVESASSQQQQVQQQQLPALQDMLNHLYTLPYEQQLDSVSTMRPADMDVQTWDNTVHEILSRVLHLMQLLHSYQPRDSLHCPVLVVHEGRQQPAHPKVSDILAWVTDDSWKHVAPALLPLVACSITGDEAAASNAGMVSPLEAATLRAISGPASRAGAESRVTARPCDQLAAVVPLNSLCAESR